MKAKMIVSAMILSTYILGTTYVAQALPPEESGAATNAESNQTKPQLLILIDAPKDLEQKILAVMLSDNQRNQSQFNYTTASDIQQMSKIRLTNNKETMNQAKSIGIKNFLVISINRKDKKRISLHAEFNSNGRSSHIIFEFMPKTSLTKKILQIVKEIEHLYETHLRTDQVKQVGSQRFFLSASGSNPIDKKIETQITQQLNKILSEPLFTLKDITKDMEPGEEKELAGCKPKPCRQALAAAAGVYNSFIVKRNRNELSLNVELSDGRIVNITYFVPLRQMPHYAAEGTKHIFELLNQ